MKEFKELKTKRAAAKKLKKNLEQAMRILNRINYTFTKDTMFVDYIVVAKRNLEGAINDHLLDDGYWKDKIKKHILT